MGEDTCLFAEEDESGSSRADEDVAKDVPEVGRNVDVLVDNLVNVEEDEEGVGVQRQSGDETPYNNASAAGDSKEQESWNDEVLSPALDQPEAQLELSVGNQGGSTFSRISASSPMSASQGSLTSNSAASETSDNDWRNWVAVHGNDQLAMEDIQGIGQTIGVTFRGDKENMFNVLSRSGISKGEISSHSQRTRSKKEKSC
jgi:hypothetical protein